jgi:hypothetical protein
MTTTISEIIKQNTLGQSEGFPIGVPESWNWYKGWNGEGQETPPSNMTAVEGWAQVYQEVGGGGYYNPNAKIHVANAKTYVHLKATNQWVLVQDQAKLGLGGGHFVTNFAGNAGSAMKITKNADGTHSFDMPTNSYNDHFWFGGRGTFAAGSVDGVYTQYDMRVDDPKARVVAEVGADWWLNASAPYLQDHSNNPGVGSNNWVDLTTKWKTLGYHSMSAEQFKASPPPVFSGSAPTTSKPELELKPSATTSPPTGSGLDKIVVKAQADVYNGGANFGLSVDGKLIDGSNLVTTTRASGQWQTFEFTGDFDAAGVQSHKVQIVFDNDAFGGSGKDRALYIDEVSFNGVSNGQDWAYPVNGSHAWDFAL